MTTEDVRVRLRTKLESAFGAEEASILMDRPLGGWNDLVTNQVLAARLDALRSDVIAEIAGVRTAIKDQSERTIKWTVVSVFGAIAAVGGAIAGIAALNG